MMGKKGIARRIAILAIVIVILVVGIIAVVYYLTLPSEEEKPPPAPVYLVPSEITFDATEVSVGHSFNVTAWVANATDLFGYQVALYYNATVINVTNAWQPSWNSSYVFYGKTGTPLNASEYFNVSGIYWGHCVIGFSLLKGEESFTGDGLLAVFEFEITADAPATSDLIISSIPSGIPEEQAFETKLKDSDNAEIVITATDGQYEYVS